MSHFLISDLDPICLDLAHPCLFRRRGLSLRPHIIITLRFVTYYARAPQMSVGAAAAGGAVEVEGGRAARKVEPAMIAFTEAVMDG